MNLGSPFLVTQEVPVHQNVRDSIIAAYELDARLVMQPLKNTERVLNNSAVEEIICKEKELDDAITFEDIIDRIAGVFQRLCRVVKWMQARGPAGWLQVLSMIFRPFRNSLTRSCLKQMRSFPIDQQALPCWGWEQHV